MNKLVLVVTAVIIIASGAYSAEPPKVKFKADVPSSIVTPDEVETRLGTLRFKDGAPDAKTVERVYDNLDFMRGVEAFLDGVPAASIFGILPGIPRGWHGAAVGRHL
jgi:hypothetical protein